MVCTYNLLNGHYYDSELEKECLLKRGFINFCINTNRFKVYYNLKHEKYGKYPHIGITAQEGISIYFKVDNIWYPFDCYKNINGNAFVFDFSHIVNDRVQYEVIIFEPIFSNFVQFDVEVENDVKLSSVFENEHKICFMGGHFIQGHGIVTAGMNLNNIFIRNHSLRAFIYSVEKWDFLKEINNNDDWIKTIKCCDKVFIDIDHIRQSSESFRNIVEIVDKINAQDIKLVMFALYPLDGWKKNIINALVDNENVCFEDCSDIYKEFYDISTYSNNFFNDVGRMLLYKKIVDYL